MKKLFLPVVLFFSVFTLAACAGTPAAGVEPTTAGVSAPAAVPAGYAGKTNPLGPEAAAAGEVIFNTNCSACHGPQGHGDGPAGASLSPQPKNLPALAATVGDDYIFWRISTGKQGTAMVAWKGVLSDEQIWQVVAFIRTLK